MLEVGDKVKFLNASGGGIVARVIDSRMVSIMIEDGFEIPTLMSELIKIDPKDAAGRFFESHYDIVLPPESSPEEPDDERTSTLSSQIVKDRKSEEIFLAFVPHDQKWLITGLVDIFLINNSGYDVLYNIFLKTALNHYEGRDYGSLFPDSKLLIDTLNREQLTHWTEGYLQFLFHKEQSSFVISPFNSEFRIEGKKFFKEGNYRYNQVIQAKGLVIKVLSLTDHLNEREQVKSKETKEIQQGGTIPKSLISRFQVAPREAVIDLHIHELVEDPANLEKSEILEFQKSYFLQCLDSAMVNHFSKVTFIHGVGNGVLRKVLIEELKKQEGLEYFDAPMSTYGVGALEIRLPHNNQ
ncbi:MAG: DUF2027 domain-containing protein [Bacteroidales bacterium]|nr:DUF2027 domain-containing protein [Bacteroidales bacterium]MDD4602621.1 DUF2027 domain-containing protein [Bacteroidales bacterium]